MVKEIMKLFKMEVPIYKLPFKNKRQYYHDLIEFFHEHPEYAGVHTHTHGQMGIVLKAAKKCRYKA